MLRPLLFKMYVNDIDEGLTNRILKITDDTKLFGVLSNGDDVENMRTDRSRLCDWSKEWLMLFNFDKCKVMHLGVGNENAGYYMDKTQSEAVVDERDLGIAMQNNLKFSKQCPKVVDTANRVLGTIYMNYTCKSRNTILPLYKSLVRPHLEYCVQAYILI